MYSAEQYDILPITHSDSMHTQVSLACIHGRASSNSHADSEVMCVCILYELSNKLCKLTSILGIYKFITLAVRHIMRCRAYTHAYIYIYYKVNCNLHCIKHVCKQVSYWSCTCHACSPSHMLDCSAAGALDVDPHAYRLEHHLHCRSIIILKSIIIYMS